MWNLIVRLPAILASWVGPHLSRFASERQLLIWFLCLLIGTGVGGAAILFRELIGLFQLPWLATRSEEILSAALQLSWVTILAAPVAGGLIVGLLLKRIQTRRAGGVADVIEARAISGRKLSVRDGLWSALISAVSLGSGASAGREGPVIHLGGTLASAIARKTRLPASSRRTLLSAGVASAISASFNAPLAGVLFAHEVILGHYSMRSFVPIVISSTAGSILSRIWFGDAAAFLLPTYHISSYWEFPAFALLGITAAAVAILFEFSLFTAEFVSRKITVPLWTRPVMGGFAVGLIALAFPHVLGVGYQVTDMALWNRLPLLLMLMLIVAKTAATAITLASRFGGGIFSPALYLGAMTGGAFGIIASSLFPDLASSNGLYAILGMGAVAGAVLGAPISTTMIVFELTGGYELSVALLLCVAIAHGITQAVHGHTWFQWQLEMRGIFIAEGPHTTVTHHTQVMDFMDPVADGKQENYDPGRGVPSIKPTDTLDQALRAFDAGGHTHLPVVDAADQQKIIAWASYVKALRFFNRELISASEEEHR